MTDPNYELLPEGAVAKLLNVSVYKLQRDRCRGTGIPFVRLGRMIRYRQSEVRAYVDGAFQSTPHVSRPELRR